MVRLLICFVLSNKPLHLAKHAILKQGSHKYRQRYIYGFYLAFASTLNKKIVHMPNPNVRNVGNYIRINMVLTH